MSENLTPEVLADLKAKSLGEKFFDARKAAKMTHMPSWQSLMDHERSEHENAGLAMCASLSHDETATATIQALRTALEEAEGRAKQLEEHMAALDAGDMAKAYLMSAGPDYAKGGFELVLRSPMGAALAQFMVECLDSEGAENYVEVSATHPDKGSYTFTVQRERGLSPAKKAAEATARAEKAEQHLAVLQQAVHDRCAERDEARRQIAERDAICREVAGLQHDDGGRSFPTADLCARATALLASPPSGVDAALQRKDATDA